MKFVEQAKLAAEAHAVLRETMRRELTRQGVDFFEVHDEFCIHKGQELDLTRLQKALDTHSVRVYDARV